MLKTLLQDSLKEADVRVIAFDPGETTGACVFERSELLDSSQLSTGLMPLAATTVRDYIQQFRKYPSKLVPTPQPVVVIEDYRVYSWKTKDHAWAGLHTPRLIGAIELICHDLGLHLVKQSAQNAKGFVTDDKLQLWDLWQKGERHARDAIRHAIFYMLFTVVKIQTGGAK